MNNRVAKRSQRGPTVSGLCSVYSVEMLWVLLKNQSTHSLWHIFPFPARVSCSRVWTVIDDLHVYKSVGWRPDPNTIRLVRVQRFQNEDHFVVSFLQLILSLCSGKVQSGSGTEVPAPGREPQDPQNQQQTCREDVYTVLREMSLMLVEQRMEIRQLRRETQGREAEPKPKHFSCSLQ